MSSLTAQFDKLFASIDADHDFSKPSKAGEDLYAFMAGVAYRKVQRERLEPRDDIDGEGNFVSWNRKPRPHEHGHGLDNGVDVSTFGIHS